jgi:hypothetical protein
MSIPPKFYTEVYTESPALGFPSASISPDELNPVWWIYPTPTFARASIFMLETSNARTSVKRQYIVLDSDVKHRVS